jgi:phosphoribosyl 1,2-cyclic phosphodiesterase
VKVTVLGSGSGGNATLVEAGDTRLLVDAGFSGRDIARRLAEVGVEAESLSGILITHDHGDHTCGAGIMARRYGLPLHMTTRTWAACRRLLRGTETVRTYESTVTFELGPLTFQPFLTVHDAADPVAVTVTETATGLRLGMATDLGRPTAAVVHALSGCDMLLLESNHDEIMLRESEYPWSVKSRIGGSHGHLSNRASAELACDLVHEGLGMVVLAHLSERCNDPGLARDTVGVALERKGYGGPVEVARQDTPHRPIDLARVRAEVEGPQLALL